MSGMTNQKTPSRRYWLGGQRAAEQDRFFREALAPLGWEPGDDEHWDAGWYTGMPDPEQFRKVSARRKLNHFPGNNALTVKSRLHDSLATMRDRMIDAFGPSHDTVSRLGFFPRVYSMPGDYHALQQAALDNPEKCWILKPKNASKGKGIRVLHDVADAPVEPNWMVQEYLANPHTIRGHKYVLRLYVLVASIEPLRLYVYRQGFAKLASEPWDPDDWDNPYSQLTNPDINALNTAAEIPVEFIDFDRYRQWLRDQGHDDERLFAQLHDLITLTAISAVDAMRKRTAETGADPQGCYELLGLDCMLDDTLKPWILECNLSPSLGICAEPETGGVMEEVVKGGLVRDMVSLVALDSSVADMRTTATESPRDLPEQHLAEEAEAELSRAGDFLRLYPNDDPSSYLPFFSLPRLVDFQLADGLTGQAIPRPTLQRWHAAEVFDDDQLALYATHTGHYYRLNDTAALIWLLATEGLDPDAIAEQLASSAASSEGGAPDIPAFRQEVWDSLSHWCRTGLLMQRGSQGEDPRHRPSAPLDRLATVSPCQPMLLACGDRQWSLHTDSVPALVRVTSLLAEQISPLSGDDQAARLPRLEILLDSPGYTLAAEGKVLASRLTLAALGPAVIAYLAHQAASTDQLVVDASLLSAPDGSAALCLFADAQDQTAMARRLAALPDLSLTRGLRLDTTTFSHAEPLGLPVSAIEGAGSPLPETVVIKAILWMSDGPSDIEVSHRQLSPLDILGTLLPSCFTDGGKPLDVESVTAMNDWLSRSERWAVQMGKVGLEAEEDRMLAEALKALITSQPERVDTAATS
jgi:tubulin polyglutamylase TTLL5